MSLPTLAEPITQLVSEAQCRELIYRLWSKALHLDPQKIVRKQWEYIYILHALRRADALFPGSSGIGFGVGREPIPSILADHAVLVHATDLAEGSFWRDSDQHAGSLQELFQPELCDIIDFTNFVTFSPVNMNSIPDELLLEKYDFCWSCSSLEHLGSIGNGIDFVIKSLRCLKPGGMAVHTTEYNISSDLVTLNRGDVVLLRRSDLFHLMAEVEKAGCKMEVNLERGNDHFDRFFPSDPYPPEHLCLTIGSFVTTSIGIIIHKPKETV